VSIKTILIADDSASMRALLISIIEVLGDFQIIEASSGFEALRLLPRKEVDLILTDINMPDINGLELLSYLRNNPNYVNIPVFIIGFTLFPLPFTCIPNDSIKTKARQIILGTIE